MDSDRRWLQHRATTQTLLLFGSLSFSFDSAAFTTLFNSISSNSSLEWAHETISELQHHWQSVSDLIGLKSDDVEHGRKQIVDAVNAFKTGSSSGLEFPLSNKVLVPLIVLYQLEQYASFISNSSAETDERSNHLSTLTGKTETLGFCTGLLAAFAISSSQTRDDFRKYGAVAVRLGLVVGAIADLPIQGPHIEPGPARCIGAEWKTRAKSEDVAVILNEFPGVSPPPSSSNPITRNTLKLEQLGLMLVLRCFSRLMCPSNMTTTVPLSRHPQLRPPD